MRIWFATSALPLLLASATILAQDDDQRPFLHFNNRSDYVELDNSRAALDLTKPFTIELWCRWNTDLIDKALNIAGDEIWPQVSENIPVKRPCGWVIRSTPVKDADKQAIEFAVGAGGRNQDWLYLFTA